VGEDGVRVVLDRRGTDRRRIRAVIPGEDRRRTDRRSNPGLQQELAALNFALVRAE
jgi:hypothetical protein